MSATNQKRRLFGLAAFLPLPNLRCVFLELRQNLFSVFFYPPDLRRKSANAAEISGNAAEIPGKQTVLRRFCFGCGVLFCLRLIFWNAAEFPPQCVAAEISAAGSSRYTCVCICVCVCVCVCPCVCVSESVCLRVCLLGPSLFLSL